MNKHKLDSRGKFRKLTEEEKNDPNRKYKYKKTLKQYPYHKKMKYKEYPKVYENVFTSEGCLAKFSPIEMQTDYPEGPVAYMAKFKSWFREFDLTLWKIATEYYWLQCKFMKDNIKKFKHGRVNMRQDAAYATFIKHYIGNSYQLLTSTFIFSKIVTYFGDFFGHVEDSNPFTNPDFYKFPYERISLAHMALVYQMDERLELLKIAENKGMSYYEFMDFVINYINCVNDERQQKVFTLYRPMTSSNGGNYYVQYHFRPGAKLGFGKGSRSVKEERRKISKKYEKHKTKTSDINVNQVHEISPEHDSADSIIKGPKNNPGS